ncbi:acyltransferase [Bacteroides uniformis]|uniref:Acyltransferase n=1 Tax=Bacteroides uniformis TaxID=820 RepID=A0A4Q5E8R2_BACUN|nr:acyltransferase [Bacteroides uniformis]KAB4219475.1 acyltransferase [Bacteroides uniformis]KAB4222948.1 acyltransferase [Bacteroides uniformis]KAB4227366.1 acyltransferase [Bacteroides uniformis]KAB4238034.1 acyltransferase [Bacteroides uniformis]KAB4241654.1 acyltransferase [Bacteroides uniformis]
MTKVPVRYDALDAMRLLAAFSVVCIHYWIVPGSMVSRYVIVAARFAVPFFFMITGFFLQTVIDKGRFKEYIHKIVMLAVGANILYFILDSLYGTLEVSSIWDVCLQLLGAPIWGGVVWYLFALIYSCIIINYIYKKKACIIKFLPFLIIGYYCLIPYSVSLIPEYGWRSCLVTNNFLFEGIPFIALGWNIRSLTKWNINWKTWAFFALVFTVTAIFEARLANRVLHSWIQLLFSTIPQTICIMMAALTFPQYKWRLGWLSTAGRKYATYIYIFHFIWADTKSLPSKIDNTPYMVWFAFFAALILSVIYVDAVKPLVSNIANRCKNGK